MAGGDLYKDLKRRGGAFSEEHVARNILGPCLSAARYLHEKVGARTLPGTLLYWPSRVCENFPILMACQHCLLCITCVFFHASISHKSG